MALLLQLLLNLIRPPPIIQIHLMSVPLLWKSNNYGSLPTNTTAQRCLKPLLPLFFIQDPLLLMCTGNSLFLFCMKYCENPVRGLPSRLILQYLQEIPSLSLRGNHVVPLFPLFTLFINCSFNLLGFFCAALDNKKVTLHAF